MRICVRKLRGAILATFLSFSVGLAQPQAPNAQETSKQSENPVASQTNDNMFDSQTAELAVIGTLRPINGKYAASAPFLISLKACQETGSSAGASSFEDLDGLKDADFTTDIIAPGIEVDGTPTVSACKISGKMKITSEAIVAGYYVVTVMRKSKDGKPAHYFGHGVLTVFDASAGSMAGEASVDAYWSVLSKEMCVKNFGRQVARDTYCIEVKIGNDAGYPLQLSGIGFRRQLKGGSADINGNLSYRSVRASLQNETSWNGRSAVIGSVEAIGLLMAGFNPFFHATNNVARFTAGTAVVGTVLPKAVSQLWPDNSQNRMNNLDDESFRDNVLIANNTQIRTTIFMDKKLLAKSGQTYITKACNELYPPSTDPDKNKGCLTPKRDGYDDPNLVKMALGNLVLVGNLVSYMQRIVVDKNALSADQAAVKPAALTDPAVVAGTKNKTITFNHTAGTNIPKTLTLSKDGKAYTYSEEPNQTGATVKYSSTNPPTEAGQYSITDDSSKSPLSNPAETIVLDKVSDSDPSSPNAQGNKPSDGKPATNTSTPKQKKKVNTVP